MKNKNTVEVPIAWFERLIELARKTQEEKDRDGQWYQYLIGYISSSEFLLNKKTYAKRDL